MALKNPSCHNQSTDALHKELLELALTQPSLAPRIELYKLFTKRRRMPDWS
jgi:hypothetical protein